MQFNIVRHNTQIISAYTAFDSLFNRYYVGLCVYSESFVGNRQTAEDLVQDVLVNLWIKREELNLNDNMSAYLYKAVHNASIQYLRHQKVRDCYSANIKTKLAESEFIPIEWVTIDANLTETDEIQRLYHQAMEQLPEKTREVFLCSREKEMKYSEIAEHIGLSVKSVEYHVSKALEVFRKVLKDYL